MKVFFFGSFCYALSFFIFRELNNVRRFEKKVKRKHSFSSERRRLKVNFSIEKVSSFVASGLFRLTRLYILMLVTKIFIIKQSLSLIQEVLKDLQLRNEYYEIFTLNCFSSFFSLVICLWITTLYLFLTCILHAFYMHIDSCEKKCRTVISAVRLEYVDYLFSKLMS